MDCSGLGKCFITGATGFIGSHLVDYLLDQGLAVSCLVRDPSATGWLNADRVELVHGTLASGQVMDRAVSNADSVFHLAGLVAGRNPAEYEKVNVEGTRLLLSAAGKSASLSHFVFVSSQAAAGPSQPDRPSTENDPPKPVSFYGRSKLSAEQAVLDAVEIPAVIIRPPVVYGPRDRQLMPLFRLARLGLCPVLNPRSRVSVIYVRDLVRGIVKAALNGRAREIYFLAHDEPLSLSALPELFEKVFERRPLALRPPGFMLGAAGLFCELIRNVFNTGWTFDRQKAAEIMAPSWLADTEKAKRELGFSAGTNLAEGFSRTADWYSDHAGL